jgi:hypothetical protein
MTDTAPAPDLYEDDFYAWCMRQAAALRRRERGVNGLDYDNLAEELRGLAKTDFRSCQSFVTLIIEHLIKMQLFPSPATSVIGEWKSLHSATSWRIT